MWTATRRLALILAIGVGAFVGGWACWAAVTWMRYGHPHPSADDDRLLTSVMPRFDVVERQERTADAPAATTFRETQRVGLQQSPVVRGIFRARELILGSTGEQTPATQPLVREVARLGWTLVREEPGREQVFAAVTQPWRADVRFEGLSADAFLAFDRSGYVKIAWSIVVDSLAPNRSRVRTETRVSTTDAASRDRFRRYWSVFSPGIVLIRYELLRLIVSHAEAPCPSTGSC